MPSRGCGSGDDGKQVISDRRPRSGFSARFRPQNMHDNPCRNDIVRGNRSTPDFRTHVHRLHARFDRRRSMSGIMQVYECISICVRNCEDAPQATAPESGASLEQCWARRGDGAGHPPATGLGGRVCDLLSSLACGNSTPSQTKGTTGNQNRSNFGVNLPRSSGQTRFGGISSVELSRVIRGKQGLNIERSILPPSRSGDAGFYPALLVGSTICCALFPHKLFAAALRCSIVGAPASDPSRLRRTSPRQIACR